MIKLYHIENIPPEVDASKLFFWEFVYFHGNALSDCCIEFAPELVHANISLDNVNDGIIQSKLWKNGEFLDVTIFLWSHVINILYRDTRFFRRRHGLVVLTSDKESYEYALAQWTNKSITT